MTMVQLDDLEAMLIVDVDVDESVSMEPCLYEIGEAGDYASMDETDDDPWQSAEVNSGVTDDCE